MPETMQNRNRGVMLCLAFGIAFLMPLLNFGTAPMVTDIMAEMNLSHTEFGLIFSVAVFSLMLFRIPWGLLGNHIGYRKAFRISLSFVAVFAVIRSLAPDYMTFLVSQFLLGVALAAVMPCLPLLVKEWAPRQPGFATGVYISGFAAGNAAAFGLTPYLLELLDWRHVLLVYSGLVVIVALLWWVLARSTTVETYRVPLRSFIGLFKDRCVWMLLIFMMAGIGSYDTLATWLPKILVARGLSSNLAMLLPLGYLLAAPVVGFVLDRFRSTRAVVALLGIIAAAAIVGINYTPYPLLLLCIFVAGFTTMGVLTIILSVSTHHQRLAPLTASVVGLVSSLGNLVSLVMPAIFGYLVDVTQAFQASLFTIAALAGVMLLVGALMSERNSLTLAAIDQMSP